MSSNVEKYSAMHTKNFTVKDCFVNLGVQKSFVLVLLIMWVVATYLMIQPLRCIENSSQIAELKEKLNQESMKLGTLKQKNEKLEKSKQLGIKDHKRMASRMDPKPEYENLRRRIHSNTKEMWYYLSNQLERATDRNFTMETVQVILEEVADRKRSLLSDQEKLLELDGFEEWRRQEAASVGDLVQRRLRYLQNPPDCRAAKKLICDLNKTGGFGCQIHHLIYCLILAYSSERTLILKSKGWQYNYSGWEALFHPLSETCTSAYDDAVLEWPAPKTAKVVSAPIIEKISPMPDFLPPVVPQDLANRIVRFNGDASSWWVGQMLKYILKPLDSIQKIVDDSIAKIDFNLPIVGVQVRRTDKYTEAVFFDMEEYMAHVHDYYAKLELTTGVGERRVYLATDDVTVLQKASKDYPQYTFYGDIAIAQSAAVDRRITAKALTGLLVDLQILSRCHYLVCTFSSNVGRMAYELMQTNRADASKSFFSLDEIYYLCFHFALDRIAVLDNKSEDRDISFEAGDQLAVVPGALKSGRQRGTNKNTMMSGLIPLFKTVEHLMTHPFPVYEKVPIKVNTNETLDHVKL